MPIGLICKLLEGAAFQGLVEALDVAAFLDAGGL